MTPLTHQLAQEWIQSGQRLDADDQAMLDQHLASCDACRAFAAFHAELIQQVPQVYPPLHHTEREVRQKINNTLLALARRQKTGFFYHGLRSLAWIGITVALTLAMIFLTPRILPQLGIEIFPSPAPSLTPTPRPTRSVTPAPTSTSPSAMTDEQVLSQAVLHSSAKAYCSWQILGYDPGTVYAWVVCEMQVAPFTQVSTAAAITTGDQGRYVQVSVPRDGAAYVEDVQKLFPAKVNGLQAAVLGRQADFQKMEWGIGQRKAGAMDTAYVIPNVPGDQSCTWDKLPQTNLPNATGPGMDGWKTYTQAEDGFTLDIPGDWEVVEDRVVCPDGSNEPHTLFFYTRDSAYQLVISFRRPDQDAYITRSGTPAGQFVSGGTVNFLGVDLSIDRLVYQNQGKEQDTSVMYAGGMEFLARGIFFTIGLDVTENPKLSIPADVQSQAVKILASARSLAPVNPAATPAPGVTPAAATLALQAQTGGSVSGVALLGSTAFVGIGPRLAAIDFSDPTSPQLEAQSPVLPGDVTGVLVLSAYPPRELVVSAGQYIVTLNWTADGQLTVIGQTALPGVIKTIALNPENSLLYAAGSIYQSYDPESGSVTTGYVAVVGVDLTSPPQLYGQLALTENVQGLALAESMLYVGLANGQGIQGVAAIPLTDQTEFGEPKVVIEPNDVGTEVYSMLVCGDRLYIGTGMGMAAYDLSTPDAPVRVWKVDQDDSGNPMMMVWGFVPHGSQIYVSGQAPADGYVPWQSSFTPPEPVPPAVYGSVSSTTDATQNLLLIARDGLEIYDESNPRDLKPLGTYHPNRAYVMDHVSDGNFIYVVDAATQGWDAQYLNVLRAGDLAVAGVYHFELPEHAALWDWYRGMALDGDRLYVFGRFGAWIFDVSSPTRPFLLSQAAGLATDSGKGAAITLDGRRLVALFSPSSDWEVLKVYDVTDLTHILTLDSSIAFTGEQAVRLAWDGKRLYALTTTTSSEPSDWFIVMSFENKQLSIQSRTQLARVTSGMAVQGNLVALAGSQGLTLLSVANPAQPQVLTQTPLSGGYADVAFKGNQLVAVVIGDSAQVIIFDVSDPGHQGAVPLSTYDVPLSSYFDVLHVSGDTITLSGGASGVEVLK